MLLEIASGTEENVEASLAPQTTQMAVACLALSVLAIGIFPGSLGNYGGVHKKVPVVTIELPSALLTPQEAEIRQMWLDLLRWTAERLGAG